MRVMLTILACAVIIVYQINVSYGDQLPHYDVVAYCRQIENMSGGSNTIYQACFAQEQAAHDKLLSDWATVPTKTQNYCNSLGTMSGGSYTILGACITQENAAASGKNRSFNYSESSSSYSAPSKIGKPFVESDTLRVACSSDDKSIRAVCLGYVTAVADILRNGISVAGHSACVPDSATMSDLTKAFSNNRIVDEKPNAFVSVSQALEKVYPCK